MCNECRGRQGNPKRIIFTFVNCVLVDKLHIKFIYLILETGLKKGGRSAKHTQHAYDTISTNPTRDAET
jgi:hypothetical protein